MTENTDMSGRGLTVVNTAVMAGVFAIQLISGYLVRLLFAEAQTIGDLPVAALQVVFVLMALALAAGSLVYLKAWDIPPQQ